MALGEPIHADPLTGESSTQPQRSSAALAHALALIGFMVPLVNIIAPLIILVNDKGPGDFVKAHARESLNFQITMMGATLINVALCFVLIGIPLLCAQIIFEIVVVIQAAMAANEGRSYRYPLSIRLLKS
jgi:uncharacterized Tic20 family protein